MTRAFYVGSDKHCRYVDVNGYMDIVNAVGGHIEAVEFGDNKYFCYINEEGKLIGLPENTIVTSLWYDSGQRILLGDHIVGNALFFGGIDEEGDEIDIPDDFDKVLERYL